MTTIQISFEETPNGILIEVAPVGKKGTECEQGAVRYIMPPVKQLIAAMMAMTSSRMETVSGPDTKVTREIIANTRKRFKEGK